MKHASYWSIVASSVLLLACGPTEDVPPPAVQAPAAETPSPATVVPATPVADAMLPDVTPPPPPKPATAPAVTAEPAKATAPAAVDPVASPTDLARGQAIYRQACAFCHDRGIARAPKTGDTAAWNPRLAQGMNTLYAVALRGKGAMPPKGGNPSLNETDVNAAVDYMVAQSR